jgi:hypothetical protein
MSSRKLKIIKAKTIGDYGKPSPVMEITFSRPISDIEMLGIAKTIELGIDPDLELVKPENE